MDKELIVNLWAIYDSGSGLIYGLCGRVYCASGTDDEKLSLLKRLSSTDYVTAKRYNVPSRFSIIQDDDSSHEGFAPLTAVHDPNARLFNEMFVYLERDLPPLPDFSAKDFRAIPQKIAADPLCLVTILYEDKSGNIRPIISDEDKDWFFEEIKKTAEINFDSF